MNDKPVDLHTHSSASDGSCRPSEIAALAKKAGLAAVALADHDTVSGVPEFLEAAASLGDIAAVPGVEISADIDGQEVHIVGLFVDHCCESLLSLLEETRRDRNARNEEMVRRLQSLDYDITLEELAEAARGESVGRPHLAGILVRKGYFSAPQDVFDKCLKRGAPAYCPRRLPSPIRAIAEIHNAGGIAIWGHPVHRRQGEKKHVKNMLNHLTGMGLDGIEAYYSCYSVEQHKMLMDVAVEFGLAVSGGSDFHGKNQPGIEIGVGYGGLRVPEKVYLDLLELVRSRAVAR